MWTFESSSIAHLDTPPKNATSGACRLEVASTGRWSWADRGTGTVSVQNQRQSQPFHCESDHRSSVVRSPGSWRAEVRSASLECSGDGIGVDRVTCHGAGEESGQCCGGPWRAWESDIHDASVRLRSPRRFGLGEPVRGSLSPRSEEHTSEL